MNNRIPMNPVKSRQLGAALVVSLLMLLVLTMIGVTGMQSTALEEKMAGNFRDSQLAFHAAESGLRDAEALIQGMVNTTAFNGTNGYYGMGDTIPSFLNSSLWVSTSSTIVPYSGTIQGLSDPPTYAIQIANSTSSGGGSLNMGGYGSGAGGGTFVVFRVTARGAGGSNTSQVFLQTNYGKQF